MEKKKKIIIFVAIFIVIFLLFTLLKNKEVIKFSGSEKEIVPEYKADSIDLEYEKVTKDEVKETSDELFVINLARNFAERFGSWSTDNKGVNLIELIPLSSARMQNYLDSININNSDEEFSGISTKTISTDIMSFDEENGDAMVLIKTQRKETSEDLSENVYYQVIDLFIISSGDKWLVDSVNWK